MNSTMGPLTTIVGFFEAMFQDLERMFPHCADSLRLDQRELSRRASCEGSTYLYHLLPRLGTQIDRGLILGTFEAPAGFRTRKASVLPTFLYCLTNRLFTDDGALIADADPCVVRAVRQVTLATSKAIDAPPSWSESDALLAFHDRVSGMDTITARAPRISRIRDLLWTVLTCHGTNPYLFDRWVLEPFGRHGPGAVAGREQGTSKWDFMSVPGLPRKLFAYGEEGPADSLSFDRVSRVILVPKDYRKPRVICAEPKELQFAQQGLRSLVEFCIRNSVARWSIDLKDQTKSQAMCTQEWATIDLSDSSDHLRWKTIKSLYPEKVSRLLGACRSVETESDIARSRVTSFATMGNALTFCVQSLTYWAIAASVVGVGRHCRVYGDDIIVPLDSVDEVTETLESFGLVVNHEKTCTARTPVRESCGAWTFRDVDCRVARLKRTVLSGLDTWVSLYDSAKDLIGLGFEAAGYSLLYELDRYYPVPWGYDGLLPIAEPDPAVLRWNYHLQRLEYKKPTLVPTRARGALRGDWQLYAYFTSQPVLFATGGLRPRTAWVGLVS